MFDVYFFENKNLLLCQLLNRIPNVGEEIKIKGRKGTIASVTNMAEKNVHVQVELEKLKKSNQPIMDLAKKKRR